MLFSSKRPEPAKTGEYKPSGWAILDQVLGGRTITDARDTLIARDQARKAQERELDALSAFGEAVRARMGGGDQTEMAMLAGGMNAAPAPSPARYTGPIGPGMDGAPLPAQREAPPLPAGPVSAMPARSPGRLPTRRDLADLELEAIMSGNPALIARSQAVGGLLDKVGPDVEFVNGVGVDKRDPGAVGRFIPSFEKGQEPLFDARGNIVGVRNMDGAVQSIAEMEGARTAAQEAAKAGFDLVEVPMADGTTQMMPRAQALRGAGGGVAGLPPLPGGIGPRAPAAGSGGAPAGFGVRQSPADRARDVGLANVEVDAAKAQQLAARELPKIEDQAQVALDVLKKLETHPMLDNRTGNTAILPAVGPREVDFEALRSQAIGGAFLEAIQALKGSGQITQIEGDKGTAAITRLQNPRMSREGFLEALKDYEDVIKSGLERARKAAGQASQPAQGGNVSREAAIEELRKRGRLP